MRKAMAFALGLALLAFVPLVSAQSVSGNISGTVSDKSGAVVPKASVTVENPDTGFTKTLTANEQGEFLFTDLLPGTYNITVTAAGFAKDTITKFPVQLNRTNSVAVILEVESHNVTVEVSGTAPPINTSTAQIEGTFESKETAVLPTATLGGFTGLGVLNLALLQPGVSSSGGVGQGTGPSVGGQRPTNNSFTIEGVDNNLKYTTGPNVYVPNDSVQEFSALQNQFSPEFGHSNGGQFNQTIKTGTNTFHGMLYDYTQNRYLNATDQQAIVSEQTTQRPRFDLNRVGGQLGGPVLKDKLFFFASGEYSPLGQAALPPGGVCAPTAAGYAQIMALPSGPSPDGVNTVNINMTNVGVLQKFLGTAPAGGNCVGTQGNPSFTTGAGATVTNPLYICTGGTPPSGSVCAAGVSEGIDVGNLPITAPSFENVYALVTAVDYNMSDKDQFRIRYIYDRTTGLDNLASLPVFFEPSPIHNHLVAINEYHTFRPDLTNELRLGYNRFFTFTTAGNFSFPGLDEFPNLLFLDGLNVQVGPDSNAPGFTIQNTYQLSDNISWTHGNHNLRVGVDLRRYIEPTDFIQRSRGDYDYTSTGLFLYDINPDFLAQRSVGTFEYHGDNIDTG
ncbi:MAG TPA: carboxypeptidase-like regulatory domain-containing protein, partial [Candidatus Acidoferrales bacterium]|nr:carboxypeptidase-like regulatory domain-containing protein [Candidatus Acidoferrales bacterium]